MNVRRSALRLLCRWEEEGRYINLSLDSVGQETTGEQRRALTALLYGTVERALTLDYDIGVLAGRSAASLDVYTRNLLRLGLYQLLYMENTPAFAAVHETVALARNPGERGLTNAVLRAAQRTPPALPPRQKNAARWISLRYSVALPLVRRLIAALGEDCAEQAIAAMDAAGRSGGMTLRVNDCRTDRESLLARLRAAGYEAEPSPLCGSAIVLPHGAPPTELPGFDTGEFFVQDAASQLAVAALDPLPGERVVDVCACPGGKSLSAAVQMKNCGEVLAFDLHESKLPLIVGSAERLGLSCIRAAAHDATAVQPALRGHADRVICDVPCSGLGVLGKKPDLRYRGEEGLDELPALQAKILAAAAEYVRPGGVLVYSTCTLLPAENEEQVAAFLGTHPDFAPDRFPPDCGVAAPGGMLTLYPQTSGTDGFFIARLRRAAATV